MCVCGPRGRSGVQDVFEMLQSTTFVQQLGYGLLQALVLNLFPEMRATFRQIEQGT